MKATRTYMTLLPGLLAGVCLAACSGGSDVEGRRLPSFFATGEPARGQALIVEYGCGSCHTIPGIRAARGVVGPPLMFFGRRTYIAGRLPNSPENLAHWISNPQEVDDKTAMPDLGLSHEQARDIAAYLYTLD